MIKKLREFHSPERLAEIYSKPHDHRIYGRGHNLRVETTKIIAKDIAWQVRAKSVADLSCGNGDIAKSLNLGTTILGDFAPTYEYSGPIEENIEKITNVDIYICSETLEHLEEPSKMLSRIREKSKSLVLTTPIENWEDTNEEHYWAWNKNMIEFMLEKHGFSVEVFIPVDSTLFGEPYIYGIWGCK